MFWKRKKKDPQKAREIDDKARVELIRERLSGYQSNGVTTEFDITEPIGEDDNDVTISKDGTIAFNTVEFQKFNVARINYDVTEWSDITVVPDDTRKALESLIEDPTSFEDTDPMNTDYWSTKR